MASGNAEAAKRGFLPDAPPPAAAGHIHVPELQPALIA
jgi:hypothetical protein